MQKNCAGIVPRGILKSYIILILSEGPLHGYAIMQKIREGTGFWKPSPGAIYPMLSLMEKCGIVTKRKKNSKFVYSLTTLGRKMAKDVQEIRNNFRKKSLEVLQSIMTSGDFARMNEKLVSKIYEGRQSFEAVRAANSIWVLTMRYFYTRQNKKNKEAERLLGETEAKLRKIFNR